MAKVRLDYPTIYDVCKKAEAEPIWVDALMDTEKRQGYIEIENAGFWEVTVLCGVEIKLYEGWILEWL